MRILRLSLAALLLIGAGTVGMAGPAVTRAQAATCDGVRVLVQYSGSVTTKCAKGDPSSGFDALTRAGFAYSFVPRVPGMVCQIDKRPDPCNGAPPDAYWSYWTAAPGSSAWTYSTRGAGSSDPAPGGAEGWVFGDGSTKPPAPPAAAPAAPAPNVEPRPEAEPSTKPKRSTKPTPERKPTVGKPPVRAPQSRAPRSGGTGAGAPSRPTAGASRPNGKDQVTGSGASTAPTGSAPTGSAPTGSAPGAAPTTPAAEAGTTRAPGVPSGGSEATGPAGSTPGATNDPSGTGAASPAQDVPLAATSQSGGDGSGPPPGAVAGLVLVAVLASAGAWMAWRRSSAQEAAGK